MGISILTAAVSLMAVMSCSGGKEPTEPTPPAEKRSMTVQESVEIDHAAGLFTVDVNANFEFRVESGADWAKFERIEGNKVYFTAEENSHKSSRETQVKFIDSSDRYYYKTAVVTQKGNPNPTTTLSMVDKNATAETKALYANLWKLAGRRHIRSARHPAAWTWWGNSAYGRDTPSA